MASRVNFQCGSTSIPISAESLAVSASLPFTPTGVSVNVRRPNSDADLIEAFVSGAIAATGFQVELSAPIPLDGYRLDWIAFFDEAVPSTGNSLALSYSDLISAVARFLGYSPSHLSDDQVAEADGYVQSGLRQFYYPPATPNTEAGYRWSFLDLAVQLETSSGVAAYTVPSVVGRVIDPPAYVGEPYPSLPLVSEAFIAARRAIDSRLDRPRICCMRHAPTFGTSGQTVELVLWPVPDGVYTLSFRCEPDCSQLSASNPLPLGGPKYSELLLESCLSVAEQRANDEAGLHTERFAALLASAIAEDRKMSAGVFGPMSPNHDSAFGRRHHGMTITYNGIEL